VPAALGADFAEWAAQGGAVAAFGEPAIQGLPNLQIPALFVAGTADRIAPIARFLGPEAQEEAPFAEEGAKAVAELKGRSAVIEST